MQPRLAFRFISIKILTWRRRASYHLTGGRLSELYLYNGQYRHWRQSVLNGEVYHGHLGGAGEIGHMVADPRGPLCGCGQRGCLEAMASGTAIARKAQALILQGRGQGIAACRKDKITAREVGAAARQGDPEAVEILDQALEALASSLSSLVHVLHPERIILGGGVAVGLADLWLPALQEKVYQQVFPMHGSGLRIEITRLGNDIGVLGSAACVFKQFHVQES